MQIKSIQSVDLPTWLPRESELEEFFAERLPLYRVIRPHYKVRLLQSVARLFPLRAESVLDLGTGDGLFASAVQSIFPVRFVRGVDIVNRVHATSTVDFSVYDGVSLPFEDASFDVVLVCNVLHHVAPSTRQALLRDISRVCRGRVLIKDHLLGGHLSWVSLRLADWIGNAPFGGMVRADYLNETEWSKLAASCGFEMEVFDHLRIQTRLRSLVFPDKNEIMLRFSHGN